MRWCELRKLFNETVLGPKRSGTRRIYNDAFDAFEEIVDPKELRSITTESILAFRAGLLTRSRLASRMCSLFRSA